MADALAAALELHAAGFNVLPAPRGHKRPVMPWERWQKERQPERWVRNAFESSRDGNLLVVTGRVSRLLVLDCDTSEAEAEWRGRLGSVLDDTTRVRTG